MAIENISDRQFIAYCRLVLLNRSRYLKRKRNIFIAKEIPIDDLSFHDFNQLFYCVDFDKKESEIEYQMLLYKLYEAISILPPEDRMIIVLKYWEKMSDQQIADQLKLVKRAVHYSRHKSLRFLRKYLEGDKNDKTV